MRVGGTVGVLVGFGFLGQAYLSVPDSAMAYALFWLGLGACFVGTVAIGGSPGARQSHHLVALAALGAALYVPTFLRNPAYPLFQDELLHIQTLELMRDLGTTNIPITNFPIPGAYPGLEFAGLAVMYASGLPLEMVVRLLPLVFHMSIPLVAYFALRACTLRPRVAFVGGLVYMGNWGYYWFHATFSYESLGILFFLLVAAFAIRLTQPHREASVATTAMILLTGGAVVVTHHLSGIITVALLAIFAVAFRLRQPRRLSPLLDLALFCLVCWLGWLIYQASATIAYLGGNFLDRITSLVTLMRGDPNTTRTLFWNTFIPLPEQVVSYLFPIIVAVLIGRGVFRVGSLELRVWRAERRLRIRTAWLALAVIGPLAWLVSAPGVLTRTADVVYRSWAFLFLGVALYAALGVSAWLRNPSRHGWPRIGAVYGTLGVMLAGAVVLSGNQAGRFRTAELTSSAGPHVFTEDLVSASRWMEAEAGRFHPLLGDVTSAIAFAVWGMQRTNIGAWPVYYTADPELAQYYANVLSAEYVTVDLRDTRYLPRYAFYFDPNEFLDERRNISAGQLLPIENVTKFDLMPRLRRVYDNGDIVIYHNTALRQDVRVTPTNQEPARGVAE